MRIRLGYVAIALNLGKKVSTSSTVTFANYSKLITEEQKMNKLKSVTLSNLEDLKKILNYNIDNEIHFYRITSALIPLVTHPEVGYWGHRRIFKEDFQEIAGIIKESKIRVDTHPDEFNVINSVNDKVVENTKLNLMEHLHLFEDINYPQGKMVLHIGGATGGKNNGIERFIHNFKSYPKDITSKLILENDDKTYTMREVLGICKEVSAPMVLDVHHHNCNNEGEDVFNYLPEIFDTWKGEFFPPKIHFSTPKDGEKDRKHADFLDARDFIEFVEGAKMLEKDFDVMIEAKQKDVALLQLVEDIKALRPQWKWEDKTTLLL